MARYSDLLVAQSIRRICGILILSSIAIAASVVPVSLTTTNGTVPGTSITYTISNSGGTPRAIFPAGNSDHSIWSWTSFPEFLAPGTPISLAVTFSAPLPANRLVWGVNSVTSPSSTNFVPGGGTASATDFDLTDGIAALSNRGTASYNSSTGVVSATGNDQGLMVGSSSSKTLTSFTLSATNNSTDGYTIFFGFTNAAACTYSLSATTASVAAAGGSGTASVTAGAGCAPGPPRATSPGLRPAVRAAATGQSITRWRPTPRRWRGRARLRWAAKPLR